MRDHLTTVLDALGLMLIAAGLAALTYRWIGLACLAVAGGIIVGGSWLASTLAEPKKRGDQ